jgi:hypothetical protein
MDCLTPRHLVAMLRSRSMCDLGHTCGEKNTRTRDELFVECRREPATDVSGRRRDYPGVLLCDATGVVVMFSSLVVHGVRSF